MSKSSCPKGLIQKHKNIDVHSVLNALDKDFGCIVFVFNTIIYNVHTQRKLDRCGRAAVSFPMFHHSHIDMSQSIIPNH